MAVRIYTNHTDDELRRAANADNEDIDALMECARRFAAQDSDLCLTENDLESIRQTAREEGHTDGYAEGEQEASESLYSQDELDKAVEDAVSETKKRFSKIQ